MKRHFPRTFHNSHFYVFAATFFTVLFVFSIVQIYRTSSTQNSRDPDSVDAAPLQQLPRLRTEGNRILLSSGQEIRLRGPNICALEFHNMTNGGRVDQFKNRFRLSESGDSPLLTTLSDRNKWNANVIRLPLNQYWMNNDSDYVRRVGQLIDDANRKGMYVILDDQWEHNYQTEPYSQNILRIPTFGTGNTTEAFWRKVIAHFADRTNLIYDIINEPHDYSAADSAAAMSRMIAIIHGLQPNAVIMVGGHDWAHSVDYYRTNYFKNASGGVRANIIYSSHQYEEYDKPAQFDSKWGNTAAVVPVFIGEFDMDNVNSYQKQLIDAAEQRGVDGWAPWSIGCGMNGDGTDWNTYEPSKVVSDYMRRLNVRTSLESGSGTVVTPSPVSVTAAPQVGSGRFSGLVDGQSVSGKIYVQYIPDITAGRVEFYVGTTRVNTEYTGPYYLGGNSGATLYGYNTVVLPTGTHVISAKVYDRSGRLIRENSIRFVRGPLATPTPTPSSNLSSSDSRVTFVMAQPYANGKAYIRTNVSGVTVNRIVFYVNGSQVNTEYTAPYYLGGDSSGSPYGYSMNSSSIAITARVYTSSGNYFDAKTMYVR